METRLLVLNAGSSSIKFAVFRDDLSEVVSGLAEGIGGAARLRITGAEAQAAFTDHAGALAAILAALEARGLPMSALTAAAHRVVHGGRDLTAPVRVTPEVRAQIDACSPLAPLHNPHNLAAIDHLARLAPEIGRPRASSAAMIAASAPA